MNREPTKEDYQELAEFRYRLRKFLHFSETAALQVGITPSQHQLLLAIAGYPHRNWMTPTEIAERLLVRHHSALGLIQRCEKIGLVRRFSHPTDKRSIGIELTKKGQDILCQLTLLHQAELKKLGITHRYLDLDEFGDS
ncbi:MarR family winged helix-turn-helix transcriptional regulator [Alicyclobacillus tolerans]|uniref:DNA-binding MarR family transcriptional regulator n=2 Tax=Alicyclobacillus tolerans TaxID=90970 RepID=A0ABT9LYD5_9BACL|nr:MULTISPECIES: MarR family transcriptional regulator [Alicyclobacillus]MDP9729279.1 DNA-binding MarR family transcriptional regulator [Alicyclobacillus tengchongensis]QRF22315.1 MarR family transcriptional regulator [Alicyclobacillus sp. TC]SHK08786.1 transcriptional regulator, MarR family [Alicyclobacillus montanus]